MTKLVLARPLGASLSAGHPWVYREAVVGRAAPGEIVTLVDRGGRFVGRGIADDGPIAARVMTTRDEPVDRTLVASRLARAFALRDAVVPPETNAYRALHGEGDRLPGLVVDVYDDCAVVKPDGHAGRALFELARDELTERLTGRGVTTVLLRVGRGHERMTTPMVGALPTAPRVVLERGMKLVVDLVSGQKTGLFLDHRESRFEVRRLARGMRVLNLYGYTGGFSIAAALGGATAVTTVDVARPALALAAETFVANGLAEFPHQTIARDVPEHLRDDRELYELVVADPPSFAPRRDALREALASYVKLHAASLARVARGGFYVAASCSSHVDGVAFDETLREGARRAGRVVQVLERHGAPADHPRLVAFPEGDYLKVIIGRLVD